MCYQKNHHFPIEYRKYEWSDHPIKYSISMSSSLFNSSFWSSNLWIRWGVLCRGLSAKIRIQSWRLSEEYKQNPIKNRRKATYQYSFFHLQAPIVLCSHPKLSGFHLSMFEKQKNNLKCVTKIPNQFTNEFMSLQSFVCYIRKIFTRATCLCQLETTYARNVTPHRHY